MPDIKDQIMLSAPKELPPFNRILGFEIDYIYVNRDRLTVHLIPDKAGTVNIFLDTAPPEFVDGPRQIRLNTTQSAKVTNFIQAIQTACKNNLETY